MERLSAIDAALIHGEMPEWHGHVTSLLVLDPASMPNAYQFEWFRAALAARLAGVARFGQRVAPTPWGVDRPVWIDDGGFDAEHHIKRLVLHNAGTIEHLFRAAGEVAGHQLEHDRPLWECYVVETRRGRLSALIVKNHHALFDGVGGLESMQAMFDLSAATASEHGEPVSARPPSVRSATPSAADMLLRSAVRGLIVQPVESVKVARQFIRQAVPVGRAVLSGDRPVLGLNAPRNPFPGWISPERTVSGAQLSMQRMKAVRHQADIKLNEVLLAVVGGALRRYLVARRGVSGPSLVANVAMSTRAADEKADSSNKFSVMFATLGTAISDPLVRLSAIHDSSVKAKRLTEALQNRSDTSVAAAGPPILRTPSATKVVNGKVLYEYSQGGALSVVAWKTILERHSNPSALCLSRQNMPVLDRSVLASAEGAARGGYVLAEADGDLKVIIIATGSEVQIALAARDELQAAGTPTRVVSMPCVEWFAEQEPAYREEVLPSRIRARVSVEAGITLGWREYVGELGESVGVEHFGASAAYQRLYAEFGLTSERVAAVAQTALDRASAP